MIRTLGAALILAAACSPSSPETTSPERTPIVVRQAETAQSPALESPQPEPSLHETWIADIRVDAAYLHFGYPGSDNLAITLSCDEQPGFIGLGMPSSGKSEIALSSGVVSETFPAAIIEGTEGWPDTAVTKSDTSIDASLFKAFRATGMLSTAEPDRTFDATTPAEKAEIENFFVACAQIAR